MKTYLPRHHSRKPSFPQAPPDGGSAEDNSGDLRPDRPSWRPSVRRLTSSREQTLYERIHQRHRTGSEGMSHYFSFMYNVGRMWRDRKDAGTTTDGKVAKALRNAFIAQHCAAVWVELPDDYDIAGIEQEILRVAPSSSIAWNGRKSAPYDEPVELVDATIKMLGWGQREGGAVERQRQRFLGAYAPMTSPVGTTNFGTSAGPNPAEGRRLLSRRAQ